MQILPRLLPGLLYLFSCQISAESLPKITGLELNGNQLSWDAQEGASGYNIHRNYDYFDTVRGTLSYTVTEPGKYHVVSFNDSGVFGVTREPGESTDSYTHVEYTYPDTEPESESEPQTDTDTAENTQSNTATLPNASGLELSANQLGWNAIDGASGYNIYRDYEYFDTVRGKSTYTLIEPGQYHVIPFNDSGVFGSSRDPEDSIQDFPYVDYDGCVEHGSCMPKLTLSDPGFFKEVALDVEFGSNSGAIKKWRTDIRYVVYGDLEATLSEEIDKVVNELNGLINIRILEADDESQANFKMVFGSGEDYVSNYEPNATNLIDDNFGLVWVYWNADFEIVRGSMFVDMIRTNSVEQQKHLLREELTQSLGLLNDSSKYPDSVFYTEFSQPTEFTALDRQVIKALYSPDVSIGMNADDIDRLLGIE